MRLTGEESPRTHVFLLPDTVLIAAYHCSIDPCSDESVTGPARQASICRSTSPPRSTGMHLEAVSHTLPISHSSIEPISHQKQAARAEQSPAHPCPDRPFDEHRPPLPLHACAAPTNLVDQPRIRSETASPAAWSSAARPAGKPDTARTGRRTRGPSRAAAHADRMNPKASRVLKS